MEHLAIHARPANAIDAASPAWQQDKENGLQFFKKSDLMEPGQRHRCFVSGRAPSGDKQEYEGVVTLVKKKDQISAVLEVDGAEYDFTRQGVQADFLAKYNRTPVKHWKQALLFPIDSLLLYSSAGHSSPPRAPPSSPQVPANCSSSRFSLNRLNGDPLLELKKVDGDGHCLIHALLLCQDRNYGSLRREEKLLRAAGLRKQAAKYIDSPEFRQVIDSAANHPTTLSQLRILPDQVSEAKRLLLDFGDGSRAAAWLGETAIAVLALMKGWNVVVLRHVSDIGANYKSEAIPTMDFFPASIEGYGNTSLYVLEADYNSNQMADWLRERLQQRCFVLLNLGSNHFNPLLQPNECNQAQTDRSPRDEPLQQPSAQPQIQPGSTNTSVNRKPMSDSANPDLAAKAPKNNPDAAKGAKLWSRPNIRNIFRRHPAFFMKMANSSNGSQGVDLQGELWLYEELCLHTSLSQEVAQDLAVLLEHSLPKDEESIEKILRILQAGLQSIDDEAQPTDDDRKEVIKLIKDRVKRIIAIATVGRLSVQERVDILHPSSVGPCIDHAGIDKDLVYESLENDINSGDNDQMIADLLCLVDDSVEEGGHLGRLALAALAHRRLPVTRAAALLFGDPRPTAEWLVTEIRAFFTKEVSQAGFEDIMQLLRLGDLQGTALDKTVDRLGALLESTGTTSDQDEHAEKVLKDRTIIIPSAWDTAARHLRQNRIVTLLQDHIASLPAGTEDPRSLQVGVQVKLAHQPDSLDSLWSVLDREDQKQPIDADGPLAKALIQRKRDLE